MVISSEKSKMLAGSLYDARDQQLSAERYRAHSLCYEINSLSPEVRDKKASLLADLFGCKVNAIITSPFFCDYGYNIRIGEGSFFNFNCVVLDAALVQIGEHVLVGPNVNIYTVSHPLSAMMRRSGLELGEPVTIGKGVWIGGSSVICPGVAIGADAVIGAGSVVTKDIPSGVLAAGNPCRIIRQLE